ncbi:MAG TPA: NnrS family protein [Caldimonas sp.]|nr:NnrS family protein [Caldimonas sp.]
MAVIRIEEPASAGAPPRGLALWQLGFRPFYLLASVFSALSIALWAAQFTGLLGQAYLQGPLWHAHEMLFGFVLAVVVGFLFTAGRNWSNRPTPTGPALVALAALWLAARLLVLTPWVWASAIASAAFPIAAAIGLAIPLVGAGNRRNYFFVVLLALLGVADLALHLSLLGLWTLPPQLGLQIALDIVLFIVAVMAGRVVPMFTNNGVPGAGAGRSAGVEKAALGSLIVLAALDAAGLDGGGVAAVAAIAAIAHAIRWLLWRPWKTVRTPLVWSLHAAYAWIPVHLLLRVGVEFGAVAASLAAHALTAGAAAGMIIAMMVRTTRGHTGLPLRADRADVACFALVTGAALLRVAGPLLAPALTLQAIVASAALWSTGFALFAVRYAPILVRPRRDGKPG